MIRGARKAEILKLGKNAVEMKQRKIEKVMESFDRKLEKKLQTNEGQPPYPFWFLGLTYLQIYQTSHLYNYLVGKDDHSFENLTTFKICKRLFGCKFFHDGHVADLQCCLLVNKAFFLFQYEAKPTVPAKNRRWNVNLW